MGVWAPGLNFEAYNKMLQSPYLANGDRIVTLDKNGIKKADSYIIKTSSPFNQTMQQSPFTHLESFKKSISGKTGTFEETLEGSMALVFSVPKSNSE